MEKVHHYEMELMSRKCNDYSGTEDCNKNIKACEVMGLTDTETGLLVRLLDKLQRLITLKKTESMVKDERKQDTIHDMRIYLAAYLFILKENDERRERETDVNSAPS